MSMLWRKFVWLEAAFVVVLASSAPTCSTAPEQARHPEDILSNILFARLDRGRPVTPASWHITLGGTVEGSKYQVLLTVSAVGGRKIMREAHEVPGADEKTDVTLPLPALLPGHYRLNVEMRDTFPGLSEDDAFLATINTMYEIFEEPTPEHTASGVCSAEACPTSHVAVVDLPSTKDAPVGLSASTESFATYGDIDPPREKMHPGYNWWSDPTMAHSLHFYDLNRIYTDSYHGQDHEGAAVIKAYARNALAYCARVRGRECQTVVDVGAGRCYFSEGMSALGAAVQPVEGTAAGVAACEARGYSETVRHDLRLPLDLGSARFDLATCTEVAEHIEPPFAGTLVHSLTRLADVVWFSSEPPRWVQDNVDHLWHSNEQPDLFWDRLFGFFGFHAIALPDDVVSAVNRRGRRIYYRASAIAFDRSALQPLKRDDPGVLQLPPHA